MNRRAFIRQTGLSSLSVALSSPMLHKFKPWRELVIGHGTHTYTVDMNWGQLKQKKYPVKDCHEMVQDSLGRIIMLTNHTKNNVIIYDTSGNLEEVWGTEFPGAHGLTLNIEEGKDFLYISDYERNEVVKTTITGQEVLTFPYPESSNLYTDKKQFKPTETAIHSNGDIYVADGYGEQYIHHYNSNGELLNTFGGRGPEDHKFFNAHGICIDSRNENSPTLLITAREKNQLKRFSLKGEYLESIDLPGCYICRPVVHGKHVYIATIWSGNKASNSGFISILDENNKLISAPGGAKPEYENGRLKPMYQTLEIFKHPHDVCIDKEENIYVCQWNAGNTYPIKLLRQK